MARRSKVRNYIGKFNTSRSTRFGAGMFYIYRSNALCTLNEIRSNPISNMVMYVFLKNEYEWTRVRKFFFSSNSHFCSKEEQTQQKKNEVLMENIQLTKLHLCVYPHCILCIIHETTTFIATSPVPN